MQELKPQEAKKIEGGSMTDTTAPSEPLSCPWIPGGSEAHFWRLVREGWFRS